MDYVSYVLNLTVAEFRAVKKAVRVLRRAGVDFDSAVRLIVEAHQLAAHKRGQAHYNRVA